MEFCQSLYDGHDTQHSPCEQAMYGCADCGKLYMHKRTLKRHELVHSTSSCFTCLVCGKQYSQQYDLERPSRSHLGEKPYKCHVCGRPFSMSHHLNNHMVTHTGIRAYSCLVCNKRFAQTFSLKRHMKMHLRAAESVATNSSSSISGADSDRDFSVGGMALLQSLSCNICGKIFSSQQTLIRHHCQPSANLPTTSDLPFVSQTLPHERGEDGLQFSSTQQPREHPANAPPNKAKKQYACSDCNKSFAHPYSLKRHRVEHGGEAHICPTCGKRFAQLSELGRHLRSHRFGPPNAEHNHSEPLSLTSTAVNQQMDSKVHHAMVSPSELSTGSFSLQVAKYMALQDSQTGLANHLLLHDRYLPKPADVGLLAFAQSLVVSSSQAEMHPSTQSDGDISIKTE